MQIRHLFNSRTRNVGQVETIYVPIGTGNFQFVGGPTKDVTLRNARDGDTLVLGQFDVAKVTVEYLSASGTKHTVINYIRPNDHMIG